MDFMAIDFETANEQRSSPCSVGIAVVRNGEVVDEFYSLIRPRDMRFNGYNVYVHGIASDMVKHAPEFPEVWPTIAALMAENVVIAHNASFDMSVIRHTLDLYAIEYPDAHYSCTWLMSKAAWPTLLSYRLTVVAESLGVDFRHHDALQDAMACAQIALRAGEEMCSSTLDDLSSKLGMTLGALLSCRDYYPARAGLSCRNGRSGRIGVGEMIANTNEFDPSHPFFGRIVVFTGALKSMARREAMQQVMNVGGEVSNGLTKKTNILVIGEQDYRVLAAGKTKSSKMTKAERLKDQGSDIELLSEDDFLRML